MKIAEIRTIPKTINATPFQHNQVHSAVKQKYDTVSFGKAHETADSLETLTFYDNPQPVHKKAIIIRSSGKFGDVTADEYLYVERHLTADNVTSPKVSVGSDAMVAGKIDVGDFYAGGELTAKSLEAQDACIMKTTTIEDSTKVENLRAWGDFKTKYLEATDATIGGRATILMDAHVKQLTSKGGNLYIFRKSDIGRIISYNGNIDLGEVAKLDSIIFANAPDYFLENPQKVLWFHSINIPEKIAIVLDKGKKLLIDSLSVNILDRLEFFEYSPSEKDGFRGKPLSEKAIRKRVQVLGQESQNWLGRFLKKVLNYGEKEIGIALK